MNPLRPKQPKEGRIQTAIRLALTAAGWLVEKTHGNAYQAGWPDLMCYRTRALSPILRWVEVKRPTGRLTKAQRVRFASWERAGLGVWVLTSAKDLALLDLPPNWREWE